MNGPEIGSGGSRYRGAAFTWTNGQGGERLVLERLDRAMATVAWNTIYPKAAVLHLLRINSDHNPILLHTESKPLSTKRNFKFEN